MNGKYSCSMSVPGAVGGPPMQPFYFHLSEGINTFTSHQQKHSPDQVDGGQLKRVFSFRSNLWWVEILIKFQIYDKRIVFMQQSTVEWYENKLWNEIKFKNILRDINFDIKLNFICKWNRIINIIKIITKGIGIWWARASSSVKHIYSFIHLWSDSELREFQETARRERKDIKNSLYSMTLFLMYIFLLVFCCVVFCFCLRGEFPFCFCSDVNFLSFIFGQKCVCILNRRGRN